jgi:Hemerythrin HHE cation binding domain
MEYKLDMSMTFAMHDALRQELVQVARIAGQRNGHPGTRLHATLGWELFKRLLLVHHRSEDDALWPVLRAHVAEKPDQVALVEALEAEHAAIDRPPGPHPLLPHRQPDCLAGELDVSAPKAAGRQPGNHQQPGRRRTDRAAPRHRRKSFIRTDRGASFPPAASRRPAGPPRQSLSIEDPDG